MKKRKDKRKREKMFVVTLEGINASGKSTVANELFYLLTNSGFKVEIVKQPDYSFIGSELGKIIRQEKMSQRTLFYLFLACFSANREQLAMSSADIIIQDRSEISCAVYQNDYIKECFGNVEMFYQQFNDLWLKSDLVYYIDVDVDSAFYRMQNRGRNDFNFNKSNLELLKHKYQECMETVNVEKVHGMAEWIANEIFTKILRSFYSR